MVISIGSAETQAEICPGLVSENFHWLIFSTMQAILNQARNLFYIIQFG